MTHFLTESTEHLRRLLINRGAALGGYQNFQFEDGEFGYRLTEDVRREYVTLLASVLPEPATLFDIFAMYRCLKENRSHIPSLVVPYLAYARQDKIGQPGEGGIGLMVAEQLRNLNPRRLYVFDVHSQSILDALGQSAVSISPIPEFAQKFGRMTEIDCIVAPDKGAIDRAEAMSSELGGLETVRIEKERPSPNVAVAKRLDGSVKGRHVLIVDDIIDTGSTIESAVKLISKQGAASIRVAATHGIFSSGAIERLENLPIQEIHVTNTLPQKRSSLVKVHDISSMIVSLEP